MRAGKPALRARRPGREMRSGLYCKISGSSRARPRTTIHVLRAAGTRGPSRGHPVPSHVIGKLPRLLRQFHARAPRLTYREQGNDATILAGSRPSNEAVSCFSVDELRKPFLDSTIGFYRMGRGDVSISIDELQPNLVRLSRPKAMRWDGSGSSVRATIQRQIPTLFDLANLRLMGADAYDIATDEDLHAEGTCLPRARLCAWYARPGTHPEYHSTRIGAEGQSRPIPTPRRAARCTWARERTSTGSIAMWST